MEYVQIPLPDFNLFDVVKLKAAKIIASRLKETNITHGGAIQTKEIHSLITSEWYEFNSNSDKLIFISELITHLFNLKSEFKKKIQLPEHVLDSGVQRFNEFQYFLYNLLSTITEANFNKDAFSEEEINEHNRKIDGVLILLDKLQVGQEIIYDEIEGLKSDYISGKKKWYQRLLGIVVSYGLDKGTKGVIDQLKPLLKDFYHTTVTHFISSF